METPILPQKNRSWKTTLVSILSIIALIVSFALVYFDKATLLDVGASLGAISAFIAAIGFALTKDSDKTGLPNP